MRNVTGQKCTHLCYLIFNVTKTKTNIIREYYFYEISLTLWKRKRLVSVRSNLNKDNKVELSFPNCEECYPSIRDKRGMKLTF